MTTNTARPSPAFTKRATAYLMSSETLLDDLWNDPEQMGSDDALATAMQKASDGIAETLNRLRDLQGGEEA